MKAALAFFFFAVLVASPVHAQPPRIDRVEVVQSGVYTADVVSRSPESRVAAGAVGRLSNVRLAAATQDVRGALGVRFGYEFVVHGDPAGASALLRYVTIFPGPMRDPQTGNVSMRNEYVRPVGIGETNYRDYSFDHDWEIIPGVWTFELWDAGRRLSSVSFTVTR